MLTTFRDTFEEEPEFKIRAPGRVNILGEHVDYNDGPVLPAALENAVHLVVSPANGAVVGLHALDLNERVHFSLSDLESRRDVEGIPLPDWALYPAGVAWALQDAGLEVVGLKGVYRSDVPIGAGLSSSAAVETAFALAWQSLSGWQADRMDLARICQHAENAFVGVASGLMDQFASLHGVKGSALYFDTRSLYWEPLPMPPGTAIVIADSGVRRTLSGSAYNQRRASCEEAVAFLQEFIPGVRSLRDVSTVEFAAYKDRLPEEVRMRAEHVVREIARVESARSALKREDHNALGALMYAGHVSLRDLYEVSTPELDALVEIARGLPGALGARLTGAGFGGCTVNLVQVDQAEGFMHGLKKGYEEQTGREAQVYLTHAADGAVAEAV